MKKEAKKDNRTYSILQLFTCVLLCVFLVLSVLHPRPGNILSFLFLLVMNLRYRRRMKAETADGSPAKPPKSLPAQTAELLAALFLIYVFLGSFANLFFPWHMPYEYRGEIARLKQKSADRYSCFPDSIPRGAGHVRWMMMPSVMQGTGFEVLVFEADDAYIQSVVDTCGKQAAAGAYQDEPIFSAYDSSRRSQITVYELYDNEDWNHPRSYGFFVDTEKHVIGFYCQ